MSTLAEMAEHLRGLERNSAHSTPCVICGGPGASPRLTAGGATFGVTCPDATCIGLSWELWFHRETKALGEHEVAEVRWQVDKRRAEVAGQVFNRPPPRSPAERRLDAHVAGEGQEAERRKAVPSRPAQSILGGNQ